MDGPDPDYSTLLVGDVKQSIYRFRGAKYAAFRELKAELEPDTTHTYRELTKNYRTGQVLLDSMHPYFAAWGKRDRLPTTPRTTASAAWFPAAR